MRKPTIGSRIQVSGAWRTVVDFRERQGDAEALVKRINDANPATKASYTKFWLGSGYVIIRPDDGAPARQAPADHPAMAAAME